MKEPNKEDFGWVEQINFDDEPSGFVIEGGEEAYEKAIMNWIRKKIEKAKQKEDDKGYHI